MLKINWICRYKLEDNIKMNLEEMVCRQTSMGSGIASCEHGDEHTVSINDEYLDQISVYRVVKKYSVLCI
jgi:hypothetical protein